MQFSLDLPIRLSEFMNFSIFKVFLFVHFCKAQYLEHLMYLQLFIIEITIFLDFVCKNSNFKQDHVIFMPWVHDL